MRHSLLACLLPSLCLLSCSDEDSAGGSSPPKKCLSQCELAGSCEERAFDDYPDYDGTLAEWGLPEGCDSYVYALSGVCKEGPRFVRIGTGYTSELRYFDEDGSFLGLTTGTDVASKPCWGYSYWPETIVCETATVTEAYCGTTWGAGDTIDVPYADGVTPKK